jgi:hypothetical protein
MPNHLNFSRLNMSKHGFVLGSADERFVFVNTILAYVEIVSLEAIGCDGNHPLLDARFDCDR